MADDCRQRGRPKEAKQGWIDGRPTASLRFGGDCPPAGGVEGRRRSGEGGGTSSRLELHNGFATMPFTESGKDEDESAADWAKSGGKMDGQRRPEIVMERADKGRLVVGTERYQIGN